MLLPLDLCRDDLVLASLGRRIQTGWRRPAQKHLGAAIDNIVGPVVVGMNASRVDVLATQPSCRFVQDLFLGPSILEDVFHEVARLVPTRSVRWYDCLVGLQIAIVECTVGVDGKVNRDECQVTGRIKDVNVHDGTIDEVGFGGG